MARQHALDRDLVLRAQAGDERARTQLLSALEPALRAFFTRRVGYKTEVDDLVQNTMLRVHNGLSELKDPGSLKAFAMKGALFELQDLYRGRYGSKEYLFDPEYPPEHASDQDLSPAAAIDLERALAALSPKARRIIELREYGYRYEEIAEMVDSTEAAIKMQVKRSFEKLRTTLVSLLLLMLSLPS